MHLAIHFHLARYAAKLPPRASSITLLVRTTLCHAPGIDRSTPELDSLQERSKVVHRRVTREVLA